MQIWEFLKDWLGFNGAVTFLYCGLAVLVPLALFFFLKCCADYYRNEGAE